MRYFHRLKTLPDPLSFSSNATMVTEVEFYDQLYQGGNYGFRMSSGYDSSRYTGAHIGFALLI